MRRSTGSSNTEANTLARYSPSPGNPQLTRDAVAGLERFRKNEEILEREWPRLTREHLGGWVAVYGNGYIGTGPTMQDILKVVPPSERDTAVVRFVEDGNRILIL